VTASQLQIVVFFTPMHVHFGFYICIYIHISVEMLCTLFMLFSQKKRSLFWRTIWSHLYVLDADCVQNTFCSNLLCG